MSTETPLLTTLTRQAHLAMRRRLHADVLAQGFDDLTPSHLYVFQLPGPDGLRPSELAARMNMTKQAANHLLSGLEARGYLERRASPGDGRAKVLRLTPRGRKVAKIMQDTSRSLEDEWAHHLGRPQLERIRKGLVRLVDEASVSFP
jgi:DNA-binding MarR family transcriptional regulator